jgi:hypothetical protein
MSGKTTIVTVVGFRSIGIAGDPPSVLVRKANGQYGEYMVKLPDLDWKLPRRWMMHDDLKRFIGCRVPLTQVKFWKHVLPSENCIRYEDLTPVSPHLVGGKFLVLQ